MKNKSTNVHRGMFCGTACTLIASLWCQTLPALAADTAPPPKAAAIEPTLQRIRTSGVLNIGFRPGAVPFSYYRVVPDKPDNDDPIGYGVDVCQKIAQNIQRDLKLPKLKVQYVPVTPKERFDAIKQGKIDIECANTSNTRERREKIGVAFTIPYYITGAKVLVRSDLKVANLNDLTGRTVAIVKNTTATTMMQKQDSFRNLKLNYVEVENRKQATEFLETRKADAFVQDDIVLYNIRVSAANPASYEVIGDFLSIEPISIMLRAQDPEFKRMIDQQMVGMIQAGELQKLYKKWFENPIPPKGGNLNVPMSLLMRDMMRYPTDKIDTYPPD